MNVKIDNSWKSVLEKEFEKEYFRKLTDFVRHEYKTQHIFPPPSKIFNAFNLCKFNDIKIVIIGQDPYHGRGQANGLCFSVSDGIIKPPSLQNIFKEISSDTGNKIPESGNLERWAKQGIFMLNAVLTVREAQPASHKNKGWEIFTDSVIKIISEKKENLVFLLWGAFAQKKETLINSRKHLILKAAHPSPFAAHKGFFGCKHFSKANNWLKSKRIEEIVW